MNQRIGTTEGTILMNVHLKRASALERSDGRAVKPQQEIFDSDKYEKPADQWAK
jgi:hypothetical protein